MEEGNLNKYIFMALGVSLGRRQEMSVQGGTKGGKP